MKIKQQTANTITKYINKLQAMYGNEQRAYRLTSAEQKEHGVVALGFNDYEVPVGTLASKATEGKGWVWTVDIGKLMIEQSPIFAAVCELVGIGI